MSDIREACSDLEIADKRYQASVTAYIQAVRVWDDALENEGGDSLAYQEALAKAERLRQASDEAYAAFVARRREVAEFRR